MGKSKRSKKPDDYSDENGLESSEESTNGIQQANRERQIEFVLTDAKEILTGLRSRLKSVDDKNKAKNLLTDFNGHFSAFQEEKESFASLCKKDAAFAAVQTERIQKIEEIEAQYQKLFSEVKAVYERFHQIAQSSDVTAEEVRQVFEEEVAEGANAETASLDTDPSLPESTKAEQEEKERSTSSGNEDEKSTEHVEVDNIMQELEERVSTAKRAVGYIEEKYKNMFAVPNIFEASSKYTDAIDSEVEFINRSFSRMRQLQARLRSIEGVEESAKNRAEQCVNQVEDIRKKANATFFLAKERHGILSDVGYRDTLGALQPEYLDVFRDPELNIQPVRRLIRTYLLEHSDAIFHLYSVEADYDKRIQELKEYKEELETLYRQCKDVIKDDTQIRKVILWYDLAHAYYTDTIKSVAQKRDEFLEQDIETETSLAPVSLGEDDLDDELPAKLNPDDEDDFLDYSDPEDDEDVFGFPIERDDILRLQNDCESTINELERLYEEIELSVHVDDAKVIVDKADVKAKNFMSNVKMESANYNEAGFAKTLSEVQKSQFLTLVNSAPNDIEELLQKIQNEYDFLSYFFGDCLIDEERVTDDMYNVFAEKAERINAEEFHAIPLGLYALYVHSFNFELYKTKVSDEVSVTDYEELYNHVQEIRDVSKNDIEALKKDGVRSWLLFARKIDGVKVQTIIDWHKLIINEAEELLGKINMLLREKSPDPEDVHTVPAEVKKEAEELKKDSKKPVESSAKKVEDATAMKGQENSASKDVVTINFNDYEFPEPFSVTSEGAHVISPKLHTPKKQLSDQTSVNRAAWRPATPSAQNTAAYSIRVLGSAEDQTRNSLAKALSSIVNNRQGTTAPEVSTASTAAREPVQNVEANKTQPEQPKKESEKKDASKKKEEKK